MAYHDAVTTIDSVVREENIDCDFARTGKLNLASKPAHLDGLRKTHEIMSGRLRLETRLPAHRRRRGRGAAGLPGGGCSVTARGGGTSMAGNAVGPGVVLEFSWYMNRILDVDVDGDVEACTARVEAGVVLDALRGATALHGLDSGPDPSSHSRCTLGGMIGNDACGNRSVRDGRTSGHVEALEIVTADGVRAVADHSGLRAAEPGDAEAVRRVARLESALQGQAQAPLPLPSGPAAADLGPGRITPPGPSARCSAVRPAGSWPAWTAWPRSAGSPPSPPGAPCVKPSAQRSPTSR